MVQLLAKILKRINPLKHKVKGVTYLSLKDERKLTKDGPDRDEPLRNELAKEAREVDAPTEEAAPAEGAAPAGEVKVAPGNLPQLSPQR